MKKKLLSTTTGRIALILVAVLAMVCIKMLADRTIPVIVLSEVKSGQLKPNADGSLMLPWYFEYESATGCVYVTKVGRYTFVVFPQIADGETRFTGEVATDNPIVVGKDSPCSDPTTSCISLNAPSVAANRYGGSSENITIRGKIADELYAAENDAG